MQLGLPTAHKLTFLSSPPVTSTRPDLWPSARQFTLAPCATNSSEIEKTNREKSYFCKELLLLPVNDQFCTKIFNFIILKLRKLKIC